MRTPKRPWGFAGWRWEVLTGLRGRVLEIGCGWGHNFGHYPAEAEVLAFDPDAGRVRTAARRRTLRSPAITVAVADAQHLAWADHSFDAVAGTLVFCSIPRPELALHEARRVLRPGGRLYLVEHVLSHQAWLGQVQNALAPAWCAVTGGCHLNRDTEAAVRAAGFEVVRRRVGFGGVLKLLVAEPR